MAILYQFGLKKSIRAFQLFVQIRTSPERAYTKTCMIRTFVLIRGNAIHSAELWYLSESCLRVEFCQIFWKLWSCVYSFHKKQLLYSNQFYFSYEWISMHQNSLYFTLDSLRKLYKTRLQQRYNNGHACRRRRPF